MLENKQKKQYLFFTVVCLVFFLNVISQDTVLLNKIGQSYLSKTIGSNYFKLKYESISLAKIKSLNDLNKKKFKHATITLIDNVKLKTQAVFKSKYILIIENSDEFIVYESFSKVDFKYAKQIFKSDYLKEFNDLQVRFITDKFNFVDITMNFHDEKANVSIDTANRIFIKYFKNQLKYSTYEYEKDRFVNIGLKDENFDGKIEPITDCFFCDRSNSEYFFTNTTTKMCNYISKKNYLIIDSSHIYNIKLNQNKTDEVIIEKIDNFKSSFYDKTISVFNKAPMHLMYDSINATNIKIGDLFNTGKYVYIDIGTVFCPPCIRNLPKLDSLAKLYHKDLIILSLLDKDNEKADLYNIIKKYNVQHSFGWSNDKINFELLLKGYPHGVLFDKTGTLIDIYKIGELSDFCNTNFTKSN